MSLRDGRLLITGSDGKTRFNSDDGLFHTVVPLSGSKSIPAVVVPDAHGVDLTNDYLLGSCPAGCTDVMGWMQISGFTSVLYAVQGISSTSTGVLNNVPISMMGGSVYLVHWDGHGPTNFSPDPNLGLYQIYYYFFFVSAGGVYLRRRVWVSSSSQGEIDYPAHTVSYNLSVGRFT